jgi:fido (protein-threonine AMPylation protein)
VTPYLQQFSNNDREVIVGLLKKADLLKEELEEFVRSGNTCNFESLQLARLRGSNTLLHDTSEAEYWNLALQAIWTWIQEDRFSKLKAFFEINRTLLKIPQGQSPIRKIALSSTGKAFPAPEKMEILLNAFESEMDSILENEHPVIQAAWIYQRLVAIHPFQNGNGRTGRLAADWMLARSGFPPLVFLSPVAAMVPADLDCMDLKMQLTGIIRIANAIQTAAQILTMRLNAC